jgi:hypothetical protein
VSVMRCELGLYISEDGILLLRSLTPGGLHRKHPVAGTEKRFIICLKIEITPENLCPDDRSQDL